jgi:hypothetical protein
LRPAWDNSETLSQNQKLTNSKTIPMKGNDTYSITQAEYPSSNVLGTRSVSDFRFFFFDFGIFAYT